MKRKFDFHMQIYSLISQSVTSMKNSCLKCRLCFRLFFMAYLKIIYGYNFVVFLGNIIAWFHWFTIYLLQTKYHLQTKIQYIKLTKWKKKKRMTWWKFVNIFSWNFKKISLKFSIWRFWTVHYCYCNRIIDCKW